MLKYLTSILTILAIILGTSAASADVSIYRNNMKHDNGVEGYGYDFEDDPLNAGGFGPNDSIIRVRPKAARTTLIRPRTSFVYELLKTIESDI